MKKIILFVFVTFASILQLSAQNSTSFFERYRKINFQFGVSRYTGAETTPLPNTLQYNLKEFTSVELGFNYDIYKKKNFNVKIGITALLIRDIEEFRIDKNEIPDVERDVDLYVEGTGSWRLNLPIIAEYLSKTSIGNLSFNGGLILGFSEEFGLTESQFSIRSFSQEEFTTIDALYSRSTAPWYANAQFGVGMYFPFEGWMLRTNLYYNFALQELYEGTFEFKNLEQSPDTSGTFSFRGNSFGIEFSVYLAKKKKK